MRAWLRVCTSLIWKDLLSEWRTRELFTGMLSFAVLVMIIFNYALALDPATHAQITAGVLWVILIFAGTLGLNRSFSAEQDQGCFDGLLLSVKDTAVIYIAKMVSNLLIMLLVMIILIPVYSLLFNQSLFNLPLFGVALLGIWGYSAAGTLIASMTIQSRLRELLIPILLFPVLLPLIMALVNTSSAILLGSLYKDYAIWFRLVVAYDIIFTTIAIMVFDHVIRE